jgi:hypothetical protein
MASAAEPTHRTLVVANRTAATPLLLQEVERRAAKEPTAFVLLVPADSGRTTTDWTLNQAVTSLRRAAQGPTGFWPAYVEGVVGSADSFAAVQEALAGGDFDDVVISTLPKRTSQWLKRDLPTRVSKLGVPVTVITPPEPRRISFEESGIWGAPSG